jgi:transposase InsO family protein
MKRKRFSEEQIAFALRQAESDTTIEEICCWAMDFMSDALLDGRTFRLLTVVDCHTRESLAIVSRTNFKAFQVVDVLARLAKERGNQNCSMRQRSCVCRKDARSMGLSQRHRDRVS